MKSYRRYLYFLGCVALALAGVAASMAGVGPRWPGRGAGSVPAGPAPGGHYGVKCFGHVDVEHGVSALYPLQPGRVAEIPAAETEVVKAGTVLLRLEDDMARLRVQEAQADLEAARAQLSQARHLPQQHQAKVAQLQAGIEALKERVAAAKHLRGYKEELHQSKLVSSKDLEVARDQVKEIEALLQVEQEKLTELQLHDPALDIRRAEGDVAARQARLQQAQRTLKDCALEAPVDGKVLRILVGPGDMLGPIPKQAAVLFCPEGPRLIRAEVEQEFAHRLQIGQAAFIEDDSSGPGTWRGRLSRISDWYTHRRSVLQEPLQFNDVRTLECLVSIDPDQPPLRIGQRVRVTISQELITNEDNER